MIKQNENAPLLKKTEWNWKLPPVPRPHYHNPVDGRPPVAYGHLVDKRSRAQRFVWTWSVETSTQHTQPVVCMSPSELKFSS
jgi:hypothetical protein